MDRWETLSRFRFDFFPSSLTPNEETQKLTPNKFGRVTGHTNVAGQQASTKRLKRLTVDKFGDAFTLVRV